MRIIWVLPHLAVHLWFTLRIILFPYGKQIVTDYNCVKNSVTVVNIRYKKKPLWYYKTRNSLRLQWKVQLENRNEPVKSKHHSEVYFPKVILSPSILHNVFL